MTIDLLKQSAIPWSFTYKPPKSDTTYDVTNTCPIDTALQMVFYLWFRGFVSHSVVVEDSLLLQTMVHIRNQNYDQAQHVFQMKTILPKKTHMDGNTVIWKCEGDPWDYRQFPVSFASNGPIYTTWENCSKKGEECPFHDRYIRLSTCHSNSKGKHFQFLTNPNQKGTIQEIIDEKYGCCEVPCIGDVNFSPVELDYEAEDEPIVVKGSSDPCLYDGTRKHHCVATFNSCPWVIVVTGSFQHYNLKTLNDIPRIVLFPPETQYSLASVILFDGGHFRGISLDIRNSPGIHIIYDGMNRGHKEMLQIISLDDPLSKIAPRYDILELWYVKVDRASSSAESGTASSTVLPMAWFESTPVPPMPPNETLACLLMYCQLF
jgi:hypothetical protein